MRGSITRRGKSSWRIKFELAPDPVTGKRRYHMETVRGPKKNAETELAKRITDLSGGRYISPSVETVETYSRHWIDSVAVATRSEQSVERYRTQINTHIITGLGKLELQKLDSGAIEQFYNRLRKEGRRWGGGLSPTSMVNVHRVLSMILSSAVMAKKIARSPMADVQTKPKAKRKPVTVPEEEELGDLLSRLKGHWLYTPALLAAYTGLRRGEVLGLRWRDIDFAKGKLAVAQQVVVIASETRIEVPKSDRSRRTITLPLGLLPELTRHRKEQSALRLRLGLGKDKNDLVFTSLTGEIINPTTFSETFKKVAGIKFHTMRHAHITHLLRKRVPLHIVSARAGHAKPSITLDAYAHALGDIDELAAIEADAMLQRTLK